MLCGNGWSGIVESLGQGDWSCRSLFETVVRNCKFGSSCRKVIGRTGSLLRCRNGSGARERVGGDVCMGAGDRQNFGVIDRGAVECMVVWSKSYARHGETVHCCQSGCSIRWAFVVWPVWAASDAVTRH